ncbi:DNA-binding protein [Bacillus mangrovi]|uniref:DNA-binding protein n=1 Tax=Metabacillus mangrovi TaxID=1491830 RepID=A0A7X2S4W5_9BACI|nr:DNA-binding protein [Metabacillus mangrovi]MTH53672.1 DNA-binding protein [Metabacillus mangrovi]
MSETQIPKIGKPAERALQNAGITELHQLSSLKESELEGLHGVGPKAIGILKTAMAEHGISFKQG